MATSSLRAVACATTLGLALVSLVAIPATANPSETVSVSSSSPSPAIELDDATPPASPSSEKYRSVDTARGLLVTNARAAVGQLAVAGVVLEVNPEAAGDPTTFLLLDNGPAVPIDFDLPATVTSGDRFRGTLSLSPSLVSKLHLDSTVLNSAKTAPLGYESSVGQRVVAAAVASETSVPVSAGTFTSPITSSLTYGPDDGVRELDVAVVRPKTKKVGYIANEYPYDTSHVAAITDATVADVVATAESYWIGQSKGAISEFVLPDTTVPRYTSKYDCTSTTQAVNMWNELRSYYIHHVSEDAYVSDLWSFLLITPLGTCARSAGFTGLGTVGSTALSFKNTNQYLLVEVPTEGVTPAEQARQGGGTLIHELGHNYSLSHSNLLACFSSKYIDYRVSNSKYCGNFGYLDAYDPMGGQTEFPGVLSGPHQAQLGLLSPDELATVALPPGETTYTVSQTLAPLAASDGVRTIRVTDPITHKQYFIEYRRNVGADATAKWVTEDALSAGGGYLWRHGVGVRVLKYVSGNSRGDTLELASIPNGVLTKQRNLAMQAEDGFTSYGGGVQIDVVSETVGAAEISITLRKSDAMVPKLSAGVWSAGHAAGSPITLTRTKNWHIPGSTVSTVWTRDGYGFCGVKDSQYTTMPWDVGATISAKITAKKSGVTTGTIQRSVTIDPVGTLTAPRPSLTLSSSRQTYASTKPATATIKIDPSLATEGTLTLVDCRTELMSGIAIDPSGTTKVTLPSTFAAGEHSLYAAFMPNEASEYNPSIASSGDAFTVARRKFELTMTMSKSKVKVGDTVVLTFTVSGYNGLRPHDETISISEFNVGTVGYVTTVNGSASFTFTAQHSGHRYITSRFRSNDPNWNGGYHETSQKVLTVTRN
jgi:hypothetical protein